MTTKMNYTDGEKMLVLLTGNMPDSRYSGFHNCIKEGTFVRVPHDLDKGAMKIVESQMMAAHKRANGRREKTQKISFDGVKRAEKVVNRLRKKLGKSRLK